MMLKFSWRNLWRNKTRTILTVCGVSFAVFLVSAATGLQGGSYQAIYEAATKFFSGSAQISHRDFIEDSDFEYTVKNTSILIAELEDDFGLTALPRVQAFGVVAKEERSFAGAVIGVDFEKESQHLDIFTRLEEGRVPVGAGAALIGVGLARNLGANVGDDIFILGSGKRGAVAVLSLRVAGLLKTGLSELDRTLILAPIEDVQEAYYLEDESHEVVMLFDDFAAIESSRDLISQKIDSDLQYRTWSEIMPELEQSMELDRISAYFFYFILLVLVTFAVINTFVMVVYERKREFGMVMAIGMRPSQVILQMQVEVFLMTLIGIVIGSALTVASLAPFIEEGIPLSAFMGEGETAEAYKEAMDQMQAGTLDSFPVSLTWFGMLAAPVFIVVTIQIAALLSMLRIRRLNPIEALRVD